MSADNPGKRHVSVYAYIVPIALLGLAMFAALVISSRDGRSMMDQYVPLQDAVMLVKNDLYQFHLSIEQHYFITEKDDKEDRSIDWKRLEHAEWLAHAMVNGGNDGENIYVGLKDPAFVKETAALDFELSKVRQYAEQLAGHESDKASMAERERPFDAALESSQKQANQVEAILHKIVFGRLSEFDFLTNGLMFLCLLFTVGAGAIIASYGRRQTQDIAALTAAGERLRENEQELSAALGKVMFLSSAVEASPDVFQITDMAGSVIYSNKALMEVYGYSPEEFAGRHVDEMNADPEFASKVILPSIRETGAWSGELTVKHRDGHTFPIWLATSLIKDETGVPVAMVGVVRDITERKRDEEELLKFKFVMDNAGEEVYIIEPSGRYAYMNEAAIKSLGYSRSEIPGLRIFDINSSFNENTWLERFNKHKTETLMSGNIPSIEVVHIRKDGKRIPKEVKPVYLEIGDKEYICSFVRDITERKNLEQYKSDFYAMITHDLKSPLTSVLACAYLLAERDHLTDDDDIALLNSIKNGGEKMVNLVEDFLTFEKAESGKLVPHLMPNNVSEILSDIGNDLRALADKKGLVLTIETGDGVPPVRMDRKQAERAIRNLIGNAIAYTPRGGLISVGTSSAQREDGRFLEVSVSDTGPGIPQEEIGKIFGKYYRSPKTVGTKGTGLGLAIVDTVAKAHGGRVEVESEPGKGSTFRLLFPIQN